MAVIPLSGTVTGTGFVSFLTPIKQVLLNSTLTGSNTWSSTLQRALLFGGQVQGLGFFGDYLSVQLSGAVQGQGDASAEVSRFLPLSGTATGYASLYESVLERVFGVAVVVGRMQVCQAPIPIDLECPPISFRWGHTFGPGDLMLRITDSAGNPLGPVVVLYRLFQVLPGGYLNPVGPPDRRPVACGKRLGVYYVTGTAGEGSQPGDWIVEWRWQRSPFTDTVIEHRSFQVLDAVLDTSVADGTCRVQKYGWD